MKDTVIWGTKSLGPWLSFTSTVHCVYADNWEIATSFRTKFRRPIRHWIHRNADSRSWFREEKSGAWWRSNFCMMSQLTYTWVGSSWAGRRLLDNGFEERTCELNDETKSPMIISRPRNGTEILSAALGSRTHWACADEPLNMRRRVAEHAQTSRWTCADWVQVS